MATPPQTIHYIQKPKIFQFPCDAKPADKSLDAQKPLNTLFGSQKIKSLVKQHSPSHKKQHKQISSPANNASTLSKQRRKNSDDLAHLLEVQNGNPSDAVLSPFKSSFNPKAIAKQNNDPYFSGTKTLSHQSGTFQFAIGASSGYSKKETLDPPSSQISAFNLIGRKIRQAKQMSRPHLNAQLFNQHLRQSIVKPSGSPDEYMPIEQYSKIIQETESLILDSEQATNDVLEMADRTFTTEESMVKEMSRAKQILQPYSPSSNLYEYDHSQIIENPYSNQSIFIDPHLIIKAPNLKKNGKKSRQKYHSENHNVSNKLCQAEMSVKQAGEGICLVGIPSLENSTIQEDPQRHSTFTEYRDENNVSPPPGFMFQSPMAPLKLIRDPNKGMKQQSFGMKKNLKLIKEGKVRQQNSQRFQKIYEKLKINLETITPSNPIKFNASQIQSTLDQHLRDLQTLYDAHLLQMQTIQPNYIPSMQGKRDQSQYYDHNQSRMSNHEIYQEVQAPFTEQPTMRKLPPILSQWKDELNPLSIGRTKYLGQMQKRKITNSKQIHQYRNNNTFDNLKQPIDFNIDISQMIPNRALNQFSRQQYGDGVFTPENQRIVSPGGVRRSFGHRHSLGLKESRNQSQQFKNSNEYQRQNQGNVRNEYSPNTKSGQATIQRSVQNIK